MVVIQEFLPNPAGKDIEGEWIKLFNNGNAAVDLTGWKIQDTSGKAFVFSATGKNLISGGGNLVLDYKTTKITLNNNGEKLSLYDKSGVLVDSAEYKGNAPDNGVYVRAQNGNFVLNKALATEKSLNFESGLASAATSLSPNSPAGQIIIDNNSVFINFSIGIFIALILTALFALISKKLELFSG